MEAAGALFFLRPAPLVHNRAVRTAAMVRDYDRR